MTVTVPAVKSVKERFGEYWYNHFNTIGLVGMHEACMNLLGCGLDTEAGRNFAVEILDFMRPALMDYQEETGYLFNLEATPAESALYRLAKLDRDAYPDSYASGGCEPYYTNSTQLPVGYTDDLFKALSMQEELQCKYTGGTVFHVFLGERVDRSRNLGLLVKRIFERYRILPKRFVEVLRDGLLVKRIFERYRIPYLTVSPTFSVCPDHGYLVGKQWTCPYCGKETEVWSRVVGFYRPVQNWNPGKREEFRERVEFRLLQ